MSNQIKVFWPVLVKVIAPAVLSAAGTTWALLDSDSFLRFCGVFK
ncbi:hypothetical protein [Cypionkella sp.]|nr:hypothetical protein [Cypionkella sp.]MDZ4393449.1 hypothetical protein [Cypionkella sp.]